MQNKIGVPVVIILVLFVIYMTFESIKPFEEVIQEIETDTEEVFLEEQLETNYEAENFSLFLPAEFEVEEESISNLILKKENQTYILFYNALETATSRLNFEAASQMESPLLLTSFSDDERFGYIKIAQLEEKEYQLEIGVGGVKITTISEKNRLENDALEMMQMANSIAYTDN
ncbi:hypothetical protein [Saliterribacillus persicus]|uniref:Uncharacterized protein n=1 Tax=Saliterribacillus persicus TaxID=930114 RepID=A0A368X6Q9_9BACI|nr:hypothetical protein [Saliterribacillus persicus]RCW62668.1 hypothetical protein DFR57_12423 [Saliterribacillus persicus]